AAAPRGPALRRAGCRPDHSGRRAIPRPRALPADRIGGSVVTTPQLSPADFPAFFEEVHGNGITPFPWQMRLAELVFEKGWPAALDVRTAAGKTAAIDIAVFHLALQAERRRGRTAPVRIAFVVDRRLVVDDAYARAERIAKKLATACDGVLDRVARRLRL